MSQTVPTHPIQPEGEAPGMTQDRMIWAVLAVFLALAGVIIVARAT